MAEDSATKQAWIRAQWDGFDWSSHGNAQFGVQAVKHIAWLLQRLAQVEQEKDDVRRVSLNHIEQTNALMTWLRAALNGEELNDSALSFALVREVSDLKADLAAARLRASPQEQ